MRIFNSLIFIIVLSMTAFSAFAEPDSNYPLYSLQNVVAYEVSQDATELFTIEQTDTGSMFVRRDIATGEVLLNAQLEGFEPKFMNTVIMGDDIYVFHFRVLNREKRQMETSVSKINSQDGQLKTIYKSEEMLGFAERFYVTKNGLLMTEKRGNRPFLFNLDTNKMTPIELDEDFRIRSFDFEKNTAVIIKQSDFSTNSKSNDEKSTYTEGDGSLLDVYLCDFSDGFKLNQVGQYQPSYVISKNEEESFLPHFIIDDADYAWVGPSFMVNRFPIFPGALIGDPALTSTMESLVGGDMITEVSFVHDQYVVAKQYSDMGEIALVIFDLKNPKMNKTETVSQEDQDKIKALLRENLTTEKSALDPAIMSLVFDAKFYQVNMITTEVDSGDGYISTMTSTESFTAVNQDGVFAVLKQNEQLVPCVAESFVLNEKSAVQFQDTLDVLFPLGTFAQKHKAFYQQDDSWIFVRDESFGEKEGIIVNVDSNGKIVGIQPEGKLGEN